MLIITRWKYFWHSPHLSDEKAYPSQLSKMPKLHSQLATEPSGNVLAPNHCHSGSPNCIFLPWESLDSSQEETGYVSYWSITSTPILCYHHYNQIDVWLFLSIFWLFLKDCLEGIKSQIKCFQLNFFVFSFQDLAICDTLWGERAIAKIQFVVKFSRRGSISISAPWYCCNLEQDLNFLNLHFLGRNEMTCVKHLWRASCIVNAQ